MICPCKDCTNRYEACWGSCPRYKEWKAPFEAAQIEKVKDRISDMALHDGLKRRIGRWAYKHRK